MTITPELNPPFAVFFSVRLLRKPRLRLDKGLLSWPLDPAEVGDNDVDIADGGSYGDETESSL